MQVIVSYYTLLNVINIYTNYCYLLFCFAVGSLPLPSLLHKQTQTDPMEKEL